jgi:hypothetical protein
MQNIWWDLRHPHGPLVRKYGLRIIVESRLPCFSKLSRVIKEGEWKWPAARSDAIEAIQSAIWGILYPSPMMKDRVVWKLTTNG